jgi:hypothetical protein
MARTATARTMRTKPADVEVLPATNPDVQLVEADSSAIRAFFGNLVAFFTRATELERHAKQLLDSAKLLEPPTSGAEDAMVQGVIKTANAAKKTVEEHWNVCQRLSALHRKLTAKRGVAVQALEDAAAHAQRLHNRWVDAERSRAQREEEVRRREEEDRARKEQERIASQLEAEALKAEAAMENLSDREEIFVAELHKHGDTFRAAQRAGFAQPRNQAERLLASAKIQKALKALQDADAAKRQAEAIRKQPIAVESEPVRMDVQKIGSDRTTWSGEVLDETETIMAFRAGKHGIPPDLFQINPVKLNEYARALHERLDLWPGVRAKKNTKTV